MLISVRQYFALMRHRRGFVVGLGLVLLVACVCEIIAHTNLVWAASQEGERQLIAGFGDAFTIAFVLALLVDPAAQHQFATEWGRDLYWAIFSPDAPEEFRNALQGLAAPPGYVGRCTYELEFTDLNEPPDEMLTFSMRVSLSGVVLERRGFRPADRVFVVSGYKGIPSHYSYWSFEGEDGKRAEYTESEMRSLGALSLDDGGTTVLDQALLLHETRVPFRGKYKAERHVTVTCSRADYFPLFQARIVLTQVVIVKGRVIDDLDFTLTQLGRGPIPAKRVKRPDERMELHFESENVALPGQASVLSWQPKTSADPPE
jgi:hypothetical protein